MTDPETIAVLRKQLDQANADNTALLEALKSHQNIDIANPCEARKVAWEMTGKVLNQPHPGAQWLRDQFEPVISKLQSCLVIDDNDRIPIADKVKAVISRLQSLLG